MVWGDLLDKDRVKEALGDADIVLHMGGLVSPMADRYPEQTMKVNVDGTRILIDAIKERGGVDHIKFVYVGSVAQMSRRDVPLHWGRTGDPLLAAEFDHYGVSKIKAERIVAESGLRFWVSLRQTGILHPGLFLRGRDPITFHVPLRGVLEWATLEDSARLMAALCDDGIPDSFWRNFYNIGSGEAYRLTNYEFEKLILGAVGSPAPEKIFDTKWFATGNFHGCWFLDSDTLDEIVPFRENLPVEKYFRRMVRKAPWWTRLAPLAPAPVVKRMMRKVAETKDYGTLDWISRKDCEDRIRAFFGSREEREKIKDWKDTDLSRPEGAPVVLSHGYDEEKSFDSLGEEDFREAARFRGGRLIEADGVDLEKTVDSPLEWECCMGHRFSATPRMILKGGHWCPKCDTAPLRLQKEAPHNPFLAQFLDRQPVDSK